MIIFKSLKWSNVFSYGPNNEIDFSKHKLVQILGKNGHGKSSIPQILEESLFNTNSRKIARNGILNRYVKSKTYTIENTFSCYSDEYKVITSRTGATTSVKLIKNGVDISAHTATATFKLIEQIIGYDHKTFTQIIYQSSAFSLEFLTATDTNRKKFLIDLLNLTKYTEIADIFKTEVKDITALLEGVGTKVKTVENWLAKLQTTDLKERELLECPLPLYEEPKLVAEITSKLESIADTNRKITQNNKYKEILDKIVIDNSVKPVSYDEIKSLEVSILVKENKLAELIKQRTSNKLKDTCSTCGQKIDISGKLQLAEDLENQITFINKEIGLLKLELEPLKEQYAKYIFNKKQEEEYEKYFTLYNKSYSTEVLDEVALTAEKKRLQKLILINKTDIEEATNLNKQITEHNTRVSVIVSQIASMNNDLALYTEEYKVLSKKLTNLQILVKAFGTNGLTAYKIECLVKDLEKLTNDYLSNLSDGRFQISFQISSSDKLNVVIVDNGVSIDISSLSNGERARVNVSTLLAIRKLLQSMSNTKVNLLILDETVENLDIDGKDKLVEVLLEEEHLNTFIISHGFSHPLLEKISVIKENNISRIE